MKKHDEFIDHSGTQVYNSQIYLARWASADYKAYAAYLRNKNADYRFRQRRLFDQLMEKQEARCAICKRPPSCQKMAFSVDHCHKTGTVRGLLCLNCNSALGNAKDDVDLLRRMIEYLETHAQSCSTPPTA